MSWGSDPNVALYIGGPKDGYIARINGKNERYAIADPMNVYSWSQFDPVRVIVNYSYGTYEHCRVTCDGETYTVMADKQSHSLRDISDRVINEVMVRSFNRGGYILQQGHTHWGYDQQYVMDAKAAQAWAAKFMSAYEDTSPKKSPEEALAWLHQKEGKDFL